VTDPKDTVELLEHGQGDLFARETPRLRRLLALRAGPALLHKLDLDDLVQEACAEAVRQLPTYSYQGRDSFFRWLAAIAVHRLNNLRRVLTADKRSSKHERPIDEAEPQVNAPGPRTLAAASEGTARLDAAFADLAEADREVILLARVEGLSLEEVARRIGRTRNAAALLLSRALRKLKRRLDAAAGGEA
jgi:RNA polymerase sigma-70 factor (ECF subfamily)